MKKVACAVFVLTMAIFLINPLLSEAGGGHGGPRPHGHGGGSGGWWVPWAIIGGASVLSSIFYSRYNSPYDEPRTVIIREQPPVYFQPSPSVMTPPTERIFVYPRQGQSEEQQSKDRYECHSWAVNQTGFDPTQPSDGNMPEAQRNQMRADYQRAQCACLDGRGYTMK